MDVILKVELEEVRLDEKLNKDLTDEIEETLANGCGALKSCNGCNIKSWIRRSKTWRKIK